MRFWSRPRLQPRNKPNLFPARFLVSRQRWTTYSPSASSQRGQKLNSELLYNEHVTSLRAYPLNFCHSQATENPQRLILFTSVIFFIVPLFLHLEYVATGVSLNGAEIFHRRSF